MNSNFDIIIVGGGAAGFFTAINIVEKNPKLKVAILERGTEVLNKVRVSGGGRCLERWTELANRTLADLEAWRGAARRAGRHHP